MNTNRPALALTVLRVIIGLVFVVHGYQKVFEMGLGGVGGFFGSLGVPAPQLAAVLVSFLELIGGALLILGLLVRPVAALLAADMLVALFMVHLPKGFYVAGGGYEFVLTLLGALVALVLGGAGAHALDRAGRSDTRADRTPA